MSQRRRRAFSTARCTPARRASAPAGCRLGPAERARARSERGQASVELLGAIPVVLVVGLVAAQLLAVGYSAVLAGTAAEAGALARATGGDAERGARASLPGWSEAHARVRVEGETVRVSLRPPSLLTVAARALEVEGHAAVAG